MAYMKGPASCAGRRASTLREHTRYMVRRTHTSQKGTDGAAPHRPVVARRRTTTREPGGRLPRDDDESESEDDAAAAAASASSISSSLFVARASARASRAPARIRSTALRAAPVWKSKFYQRANHRVPHRLHAESRVRSTD